MTLIDYYFSAKQARVGRSESEEPRIYVEYDLDSKTFFEYTEHLPHGVVAFTWPDKVKVGIYDEDRLVLLPAYGFKPLQTYSIGNRGARGLQLTLEEAQELEAACDREGYPMPIITGYASRLAPDDRTYKVRHPLSPKPAG